MFKRLFARKNDTKQPFTRVDIIAIVLGLGVFAALSLATITASSIWFDEAFSAYIIRFNFAEIWAYTAADVLPPLYYWLLKIWGGVFGHTELGLRSMSVFFGAVALVFSYLLTRRLFGRKTALYTLGLLAISPMVIRYSQEMRTYMLVAAITLSATYVLVRAMEAKKNRKLWVVYGILVSLGMWAHHFTAVVWLAHWAWRAYAVRSEKPKKFWPAFFTKDWVRAHVVAVGLYLPWLPFLIRQVADVQGNGFWIGPVSPASLTDYVTNTLYYLSQSKVTPWLTLMLIVLIGYIVWLAVRVHRGLSVQERRNYALITTLAFLPPLLLIVLSMPPLRSVFIDRYLITSLLMLSVFMAVTLSLAHKVKIRPIVQAGAGVLVVAALLIGVTNVYHYGNYNKTTSVGNGTRQLVEKVQAASEGTQPIIARTPWIFYEAVFYDTAKNPVYFLDASTTYNVGSLAMLKDRDDHKIKDVAAFSKEHAIVWYIGRPGSNAMDAPDKNWVELQTITSSDPFSGEEVYIARQYQTNAE